jgi:glycosyltransferase involved in cell wall biosynthesis
MPNNIVSIITPTFNCGKFIQDTYESILRQTYEHWEWIVVDDGSTDNTVELVGQWQRNEPRIKRYRRNEEPRGAANCRNIGVKNCSGDYLIFLDGDDILSNRCLSQRIGQMLANPDADFIVFQMMLFQQQPDDLRLLWNLPDGRDDLERAVRLSPVMAGSSTIWKKQSFINIGMWDNRLLMNQDIELHIRAMCKPLKYMYRLQLPPDLYVRNNPGSISREKTKSREKQFSRVYYFNRVYHHLRANQLDIRYAGSIRWLFLKLFFDMSYDGAVDAAKSLCLEQDILLQSFPRTHRLIIGIVQFSGKYGRIPVALIRAMNKLVSWLKGGSRNTFGVLRYEGEIG